ncbi:CsbD family protein [Sphingoaurantiacus capsulatus]|uniref:CsbD family protein n=1 Tax=Sphingoaurantiacus capsulatus TaxID=1771310 RepID=A0ABV7X616_9SPHN
MDDEMKNRAKGVYDETMGKAKRAVGDATNRPDIRAEGDAQEALGDAEKEAARREEARKDGLR